MATAIVGICCTGTTATILRTRTWKTGTTLKLAVSVSRATWPASTPRRSWVSWLVSSGQINNQLNYAAACVLFVVLFYFFAAHMPAEAWVGLNDIVNENHFVYTDGTPAVSGEKICSESRYDLRSQSALLSSVGRRTSSLGGPTNQTTGRTTKTACTSEEWITLSPGCLMMTFAPPQGSIFAKKVSCSFLYCSSFCFPGTILWSLFCLSAAKGQGPPPQPPTSGPGPHHATIFSNNNGTMWTSWT